MSWIAGATAVGRRLSTRFPAPVAEAPLHARGPVGAAASAHAPFDTGLARPLLDTHGFDIGRRWAGRADSALVV